MSFLSASQEETGLFSDHQCYSRIIIQSIKFLTHNTATSHCLFCGCHGLFANYSLNLECRFKAYGEGLDTVPHGSNINTLNSASLRGACWPWRYVPWHGKEMGYGTRAQN